MPDLDDARRMLKEVFGFTKFRAGQKRVIRTLLEGRSALAVLPTGGGKSLTYQLPALLLNGLTLVVSPLIALMKDQVDFLTTRNVPAARLDSSLDAAQNRRVYNDLRSDRLRLLYVAPERLASERFLNTLAGRRIAILAVDEAHCISQWGHNFRPEYLKVARLAAALEVERILALTATATAQVVFDIADAFGIEDDHVVITSFHRPNLELHATPCHADERRDLLLERLQERPAGPTIVYVTTQKTAEQLADDLAGQGFDAVPYHAGMDDERRHEIQEAFMASDAMVVVATIAFGMGIDKADVRYVYHHNLPKSLEGYAQETGRAGRDGLPAVCELFACTDDVVTLENYVYGDTPTPEALASLLADVLARGDSFDVSIYELSNAHDIRQNVVKTLLTYLEMDGVLAATGASYAKYTIRPLRPFDEIGEDLPNKRAELARRLVVLRSHQTATFTLDVADAAEALSTSRTEIASVLADLELRGDVTLKPSCVREGYRRLQSRFDLVRLREAMVSRFDERERRDVARVHEVLGFARGEGCLTRTLLSYFGEELEEDCGHCDRCLGVMPEVPPESAHAMEERECRIVDDMREEPHVALATPRQKARFLCGLTSPATIRARLTRDIRFGALSHLPFGFVLKSVSRKRFAPM